MKIFLVQQALQLHRYSSMLYMNSDYYVSDLKYPQQKKMHCHQHTCQVGKVKKREISLFASCQSGRYLVKQFYDIYFVQQDSKSSWNFGIMTFPPISSLYTIYPCTWFTLCWPSNAVSFENSIQSTFLSRKMIGRRWDPQKGRFSFLGGRCMNRREMGSKRGSLPPKETWHVCTSVA